MTTAAVIRTASDRLAELCRPDPTWGGMSIFGWPSDPAEALVVLDQLMARAELAPEVPQEIRTQFDNLRELFRFGLLKYPFFTMGGDQPYLVAETAFRAAFLDYYDHAVPLISKTGKPDETIEASQFEGFLGALNRRRWRNWFIGSKATGQHHDNFDGSFRSLLHWAFDERVLPGRKVAHIKWATGWRRNFAGHPTYHLDVPSESARELRNVAELINRLGVRIRRTGSCSLHGILFREAVSYRSVARLLGMLPPRLRR